MHWVISNGKTPLAGIILIGYIPLYQLLTEAISAGDIPIPTFREIKQKTARGLEITGWLNSIQKEIFSGKTPSEGVYMMN